VGGFGPTQFHAWFYAQEKKRSSFLRDSELGCIKHIAINSVATFLNGKADSFLKSDPSATCQARDILEKHHIWAEFIFSADNSKK
jgi:hypothetical protein